MKSDSIDSPFLEFKGSKESMLGMFSDGKLPKGEGDYVLAVESSENNDGSVTIRIRLKGIKQ